MISQLMLAGSFAFGPTMNPDDQYRFFWYAGEQIYDRCRDAGFNMFINTVHPTSWWPGSLEERRASDRENPRLEWIGRMAADRFDHWEKLTLPVSRYARSISTQTNKDGSRNTRSVNLADEKAVETFKRLIREAAQTFKGYGAVNGLHTSSEIRDGSKPSFDDAFRAKVKRELGYGMPEEITTSRLTLQSLADLPESHVVETNYRPLEYLAWFWRQGDGWNDYQDWAAEIFREELGRPDLPYLYDPIVRTPPLWGSGGRCTVGDMWFYATPEPYSGSYIAAEQFAMARGCPGRATFMMPSGIIVKSWGGVPDEFREGEAPEWGRRLDSGVRYISMPGDLIREAVWTLFSRRLDGIGLYAWTAMFKSSDSGYSCTSEKAFPAVVDAFRRVGVPLGPLLRAIPERKPEVAILESYASSILASAGSMGWGYHYGDMATMANLPAYVLYEEEIARTGVPPSLKVIMLPDTPVLTRPTYEALLAFRKRGGVLAGNRSCVPVLGLDVMLPELNSRGERMKSSAKDIEITRAAAARMKKDLAFAVAPYADTDRPSIFAHVRSCGPADYVFAINDNRGFDEEYLGRYRKVCDLGLPNEGRVLLRRAAGAVYDLEKHAEAPFTVKDGITTIPVSYKVNDGRLFLVSPRRLAALGVEVNGGRVRVTSADSDLLIPIAVSFSGGGSLRDGARIPDSFYGVIERGVWEHEFASAEGLAVRNLADGSAFAAGAKAGARNPDLAPSAETPAPKVLIDPAVRAAAEKRNAGAVKVSAEKKPYRMNIAWSLNDQNDHSTVVVASAKVNGKGGFRFHEEVKGQEAVELWFGRPDRDLYVTLNGVYLGQFDAKTESGREFRLDATKETKLGDYNKLVVKDAEGNTVNPGPAGLKVQVKAVKW